MHSSGHRILFADADGASHFPDVALLLEEMDRLELEQDTTTVESKDWVGGHGVIVGSRAHLVKSEAVVKVSFILIFPLPWIMTNVFAFVYSVPS